MKQVALVLKHVFRVVVIVLPPPHLVVDLVHDPGHSLPPPPSATTLVVPSFHGSFFWALHCSTNSATLDVVPVQSAGSDPVSEDGPLPHPLSREPQPRVN